MTLLADKDERFKNLFGKAAIFILVAMIGLGGTFLWAGVKKGAFTAKFPIYFIPDSGQNLSEGMPVKFSGFKIGKLSSMALDEDGHVQVEVAIDAKYLGLIKQDAVINFKKEGVIGDGVLEISRGSENKPALAAGDKVSFERSLGLEQAVNDVKDRLLPVLDDLQKALHDPQGDVRQTLTNLRALSAEMRGTRERIDRVLDKVDVGLDQEVAPLLRSLRQSATHAESMSTKLDQDFPALLNKADASMENLRISSEIIKDTVQRSAPQLQGVLGDARETVGKTQGVVDDTQQVLDSLSTNWPLKNILPAPESGPVKMDSHD